MERYNQKTARSKKQDVVPQDFAVIENALKKGRT